MVHNGAVDDTAVVLRRLPPVFTYGPIWPELLENEDGFELLMREVGNVSLQNRIGAEAVLAPRIVGRPHGTRTSRYSIDIVACYRCLVSGGRISLLP